MYNGTSAGGAPPAHLTPSNINHQSHLTSALNAAAGGEDPGSFGKSRLATKWGAVGSQRRTGASFEDSLSDGGASSVVAGSDGGASAATISYGGGAIPSAVGHAATNGPASSSLGLFSASATAVALQKAWSEDLSLESDQVVYDQQRTGHIFGEWASGTAATAKNIFSLPSRTDSIALPATLLTPRHAKVVAMGANSSMAFHSPPPPPPPQRQQQQTMGAVAALKQQHLQHQAYLQHQAAEAQQHQQYKQQQHMGMHVASLKQQQQAAAVAMEAQQQYVHALAQLNSARTQILAAAAVLQAPGNAVVAHHHQMQVRPAKQLFVGLLVGFMRHLTDYNTPVCAKAP